MRANEKAVKTLRLLVDVHYLKDGKMRWQICEPDSRKGSNSFKKWKPCATQYCASRPSSDQLFRVRQKMEEMASLLGVFLGILQYEARKMEMRAKKNMLIQYKEAEAK